MNLHPKASEVFDKENPPHFLSTHKKTNSIDEPIPKKAILGENTQLVSIETVEDQCPSSPLGDSLMQRKRKNQAKRQVKGFKLNLVECWSILQYFFKMRNYGEIKEKIRVNVNFPSPYRDRRFFILTFLNFILRSGERTIFFFLCQGVLLNLPLSPARNRWTGRSH